MSLSASQLIANIRDQSKNGLLQSVDSLNPADSGYYFRGDRGYCTFIPVVRSASDDPYWIPPAQEIDPSELYLGVGDIDLASESGTTDLNYNSIGTGLTAVSATVTAANLQTQLNASAPVIATGQTVAVTELSPGAFQLLWSGFGAKYLFQGDPDNLIPESVVAASWFREGDGSNKAIQLLQFIQRPYIYVTDWTAITGATVAVTELAIGAASPAVKASFRLILSQNIYGGSFSVKGSAGISYNSQPTDMLEALGTDWETVIQNGSGDYTITRATAAIYALTGSDINVTGLSSYPAYEGQMKFNGAALYKRFLLEGGDFSSTMEIRFDDGDERAVMYQGEVSLNRDLLNLAALSPSNWDGFYFTKTEILALIENFVTGPASSTNGEFAFFNGLTGKLLKALGITFSTDGTFSANSDLKIPSEKAVKTFVSTAVLGLERIVSDLDCSANPNYPAAAKGDGYRVTGTGKIGGASGPTVQTGDVFYAKAANAGGDQAAVGGNWYILEGNRDPASTTVAGYVRLSTDAEALAGAVTSAALTPSNLPALGLNISRVNLLLCGF